MTDLVLGRRGKVRVDTPRPWPIIVVPGIMGTRLRHRSHPKTIWDPDSNGDMVSLAGKSPQQKSRLLDPARTPGIPWWTSATLVNQANPWSAHRAHTQDEQARGWGGPSRRYYGLGIQQLQQVFARQGGVVWAFGYDWRMDNRRNGKRLLDWIEGPIRRRHGDVKPIIVTHSMGGLVTRAACKEKSASGKPGKDLIAAVIHTFQPSIGTPEAYAGFKMGSNANSWLPSLGKIIGIDPNEAFAVRSPVTAMFQLMPSHQWGSVRRKWLDWSSEVEQWWRPHPKGSKYSLSDPWAIYRESHGYVGLADHSTMKQGTILARNKFKVTGTARLLQVMLANINRAEKFHRWLGNDYHPITHNFWGTSVKTITHASILVKHVGKVIKVPRVDSRAQTSMGGDETVALDSSRHADRYSKSSTAVARVGHASMFNHMPTIRLVARTIRRIRAGVGATGQAAPTGAAQP